MLLVHEETMGGQKFDFTLELFGQKSSNYYILQKLTIYYITHKATKSFFKRLENNVFKNFAIHFNFFQFMPL